MKKIFLALLACLLGLVLVIIARAIFWQSRQIQVAPVVHSVPLEGYTKRLSSAVQYQTVSYDDRPSDSVIFANFEKFLVSSFPKVHSMLKKEKIGRANLVYYWEGRNKNLPASMLLAHQDVVPAEGNSWSFDPFRGIVDSNFVYGRGCLDDKGSLMGILEATELLLLKGFRPERSLYIAFGHDEEKGGKEGAALIAEVFVRRRISIEYVLDEGGVIISGAVPRIAKPVAVVGIAEKGYMSIEMAATAQAGHTSMPPKETAIMKLSNAIIAINESPFEGELAGATKELFSFSGPEMGFPLKVVFANQWLFAPVIKKILSSSPSTNATIRTTSAFTILKAGTKENVLPITARAVVNLRIIPGETIKGVLENVKSVVNDTSISFKVLPFSSEPSIVSDIESRPFKALNKTIRQIFPDCIVAPYLVIAATDARYFSSLTKNIYRFFPARLHKNELKMIHGTDEKLSFKNYAEIINFYHQLIRNTSNP